MLLYEKPIRIELLDSELIVNGQHHSQSVRHASKMRQVLMDKQTDYGDPALYYMYRGIHKFANLRYDITYIPANLIGSEYAKTYGHYHQKAKDGMYYPEIYQVLSGKVVFLLQLKNKDESVNVIIVNAREGEIILLPPGYGHVSINPTTDKNLVLANIVSESFENNYEDYKNNQGAAYYYTQNGLVQNSNYIIRNTEKKTPQELNKQNDFYSADLLNELYKNPKEFEFLEWPSLKFKQ